ncbi:MAG: hypothetical protein SRB2_00404 [Desulfobacteraceae bacterium Eth-SRB2]|nr:MAG: hypothetical protein SRB2_00404 [Desulfobacteraceae bacterium Eth-SRB2]
MMHRFTSIRFKRATVFFLLVLFLLLPQAAHCLTDSAETYFIPWSGYWWPTRGGGLANGYGEWGHPAPLEKLELLTKGQYPGQATQWELQNYYDPMAPSWYGQCHAWAQASAFENIVFYPSSYENILFRVGDKKGLLSACHGSDPAIRATGQDGPHIFHEWLLTYIKVNRKSFVADLGTPGEAWFYPIYKYEMRTAQAGNVIHVVCTIWYADDRVEPDFQGTLVAFRGFTYDLFVNSNNEITGGEWTGVSVYTPPKSLIYPLSPQSTNPFLDYPIIKEIALHKDDFLEDDDPVRLLPGTYNLILLNQDIYTVECRPGDIMRFEFEKLDEFDEGMDLLIQDASGDIVRDESLENNLAEIIPADNPPYTLKLSRDNYGGGGIYRIIFDLTKDKEFFTNIQKGSAWNGLAVTNGMDTPCADVQIVVYDQDNSPIATVLGPETIAPNAKRTFCLSNLPIRSHEVGSVFGLKVLTDDPLSILYLGGVQDQSMSGFGRKEPYTRRFVMPDTSGMYNANKYVSWSLYNKASTPTLINLFLYTEQGILDKETSLEIMGNSVNRYTPSNNPFYKNIDNGWIMLEVQGDNLVQGYCHWAKDGSGGADSIYAINHSGRLFYVPHIASTDLWATEVTFINLYNSENEIALSLLNGSIGFDTRLSLLPFEKRSLLVSDLFSAVDENTLNQAALMVTSQGDITGYFAYKTGSSSADYALMTINDAENDLMIPHVASNEYWWTGLALLNPYVLEETVQLMPFNQDGTPIDEELQTLQIPKYSKKTIPLRTLFSTSIMDQIAWVKLSASGDGLMGLFLYGGGDVDVLSGSALYPAIPD